MVAIMNDYFQYLSKCKECNDYISPSKGPTSPSLEVQHLPSRAPTSFPVLSPLNLETAKYG